MDTEKGGFCGATGGKHFYLDIVIPYSLFKYTTLDQRVMNHFLITFNIMHIKVLRSGKVNKRKSQLDTIRRLHL